MADMEAGRWIIGLSVWFIFVFLLSFGGISIANHYGLNHNITIDDGGLTANSLWENDGGCIGASSYDNFPKAGFLTGSAVFQCSKMTVIGVEACDYIDGCNATTPWFGDPECGGTVNNTFYNLSEYIFNYTRTDVPSLRTTTCLASGLQDPVTCKAFGCEWASPQEILNAGVNIETVKVNTIWQTISFMGGFSSSYGVDIEPKVNIAIAFIITYIPMLMLLIAIYMLLPFI